MLSVVQYHWLSSQVDKEGYEYEVEQCKIIRAAGFHLSPVFSLPITQQASKQASPEKELRVTETPLHPFFGLRSYVVRCGSKYRDALSLCQI